MIAFAVSVTHWIEIGGAVPGSISPEATEIYQEGLQLPGVRIVEQGAPSRTLIDLIEANIRLPRTGIGDLNAGLAATAIGEARVREACERYGVELVLASFARVLDHGEQIARAELRTIPNGVYRASGVIDGDGVTDAEIPIAVAVTVGDDFLHADFTGCAPQTRGPVNCSTGALLSACKTVVRAITAPAARSNDGFFRPFSLSVPPGTVFSAEPPAPTGWYYEGAAFANDLIWKALAPVVPERLGAGSYTSLCCSYIVGTDEAGELFVLAEPNVGGWGGSALGDGGLGADRDDRRRHLQLPGRGRREPVPRARRALRAQRRGGRRGRSPPRRLRRRALLPRARRAGRPRATAASADSGASPWALGGGSPGTENFLDYTTTDLRIRRGRVPRVRLGDGAVVSSVTGTGGGFGDPFEREPERVCEDVLDGYVTADEARATYGVALDPVSLRPGRGRDGQAAGPMTLRVATDIGGTFTDLVVVDSESGDVRIAKVSTTPRDLAQGVLDVIAAGELEPAAIEELVHGTTVVINALTERTGHARRWSRRAASATCSRSAAATARTCTTSSRASRRRSCRAATASRCASGSTAHGTVLVPLDPADAEPIAAACERDGIEAVAVCLLHSYAHPEHEQALCSTAAGAAPRRRRDRLVRRHARVARVRAHEHGRAQRLRPARGRRLPGRAGDAPGRRRPARTAARDAVQRGHGLAGRCARAADRARRVGPRGRGRRRRAGSASASASRISSISTSAARRRSARWSRTRRCRSRRSTASSGVPTGRAIR